MSSWYRTGTIALTNGSTTVTGSGTAFIANAQIGEALVAPDGRVYEITNIPSDTSLTISPAYLGSTASGQAYAIAPLRGRIAQLLSETSSLLSSFATVRDGIGAGLFPDGTQALPGLRFAADQDTGLRRFDTNALALVAGGVDQLMARSGNIGVAAAPATGTRLQVNGRLLATGGASDPSDGSPSGVSISYDTAANIGHVASVQTGVSLRELRLNGSLLSFLTAQIKRLEIDPGGNVQPGADNTQVLGSPSLRWSTVFAGTGAINTSDEREKEWRGPLNEAELRAAKRIAAEIGIFQFLDAVAEKGEDARLHCGVRAQQVFAILEDEGLQWQRYAWCCHDEWDAEGDLPAGDRYGIRPDQLALWLIAAQEQRLLALEAA